MSIKNFWKGFFGFAENGFTSVGKSIYTYYKNRLVEIGGANKSLCLKNVTKKGAYDIGRVFSGREDKIAELIDTLWHSKSEPITLLSEKEFSEISENLGATEEPAEEDTADGAKKKRRSASKYKLLEDEVAKIKELKREVEDFERESGRYEMYIGYPFVFGSLSQGSTKMTVKAPLLLFPVRVDIPDERTVELRLDGSGNVQLNPALIFAYAESRKVNIDELELEFDGLRDFKSIRNLIEYLAKNKVKIDFTTSKNIYPYSRFKEPDDDGDLSIRYAAILGRFSLSNSIYTDYSLLEKKNLTNDAVNELLRMNKEKKAPSIFGFRLSSLTGAEKPQEHKSYTAKNSYIIKMLDYAQSECVRQVDKMGNMVIYGPPGTGKSQTIVNIITDAMVKNKKVLVVSQKKAALDVVYSRLGTLSESAIYINNEAKEKKEFYERCAAAHKKQLQKAKKDMSEFEAEYNELEEKIAEEKAALEEIYSLLNDKRPFGLSLTEMYSSSYMLPKNSSEHNAYLAMQDFPDLLSMNYKELSEALFKIKAKELADMYYAFSEAKGKNPLIDLTLPDIEMRTLDIVKEELSRAEKAHRGHFPISRYPYIRQVLAHYSHLDDEKNLHAIVKLVCKLENPQSLFNTKAEEEMAAAFKDTKSAIDKYIKNYECLKKVLTPDGYFTVIDNLLHANRSYTKLVHEAIDDYIEKRDITNLFRSLDKNTITVLSFAYSATRTKEQYSALIDKIMLLRIYHELTLAEETLQTELAKTLDFRNITSRIYKLKEAELSVAYKLCQGKSSEEYARLISGEENAKDYLYQIQKEQKYWPIRKMMEVYGNYIINLFPCWLLSPENVSSLLPLNKNMFDIVIFDEASQVFIESTIPTIYRGKNIVVAGDSKQLRPSATFMKRYLGTDIEAQEDYSLQAALEVESLLDLAVSRYGSANLTYHYRSRSKELIDFSNYAFYGGNLQVAPNISANKSSRPIERYKIDGRWTDRTNPAEAEKIVDIIDDILKTRKNKESIGIITFNIDQQTCIQDAIDNRARDDEKFRARILKERERTDGGEDTSLFIKNLENVQGDERDIIIFSIGYAPNDEGKLYTNFGSLSAEGGENRLNVAITRAKSKIIVVTSIEPEDLKVENSKNLGPRLLRDYLAYVRAVSEGDYASVDAILSSLDTSEKKEEEPLTDLPRIEEQIKSRLEEMGYTVHTGLGNQNNRISLAIYDEESDRYLVGVILDTDAFMSSGAALERDVYKPKFLEARGWTLERVWCRDFWLSPSKVVKSIASAAEKNRK